MSEVSERDREMATAFCGRHRCIQYAFDDLSQIFAAVRAEERAEFAQAALMAMPDDFNPNVAQDITARCPECGWDGEPNEKVTLLFRYVENMGDSGRDRVETVNFDTNTTVTDLKAFLAKSDSSGFKSLELVHAR
jgi:hypothetical protein